MVNIEKGKLGDFYSRIIPKPGTGYMVTKKELLSIVKNLKYFRTISFRQQLELYTYHKNITCKILILIEY